MLRIKTKPQVDNKAKDTANNTHQNPPQPIRNKARDAKRIDLIPSRENIGIWGT